MHVSVLLEKTIAMLNLKEDGIYVDCTVGYGGHSQEILKRITRGQLFAFDQDSMAILYCQHELIKIGHNFELIKSNFSNLKKELALRKINQVDGILFDLGVSSPQLDMKERGFSYQKEAKLDMRMDQDSSLTAYDVVNYYPLLKLTDVLFRYGEEKDAKKIATAILTYRKHKKINTTLELATIISQAVSLKRRKKEHPARKTFQAIRIEVNNELEVLKKGLEEAIFLLKPKGRLCIITFHSLEDRICKRLFKKYSEVDPKVKGLPHIPKAYEPIIKIINKKVITPSPAEINKNIRARSAKLRVIEKI